MKINICSVVMTCLLLLTSPLALAEQAQAQVVSDVADAGNTICPTLSFLLRELH